MKVEGSAILVTGGASGLGLGTAQRFLGRGARVVIADVNEAKGADALAGLGDNASFVPCDITDPDQVSELVEATSAELGRTTSRWCWSGSVSWWSSPWRRPEATGSSSAQRPGTRPSTSSGRS